MSKITTSIQQKVQKIMAEQNETILERPEVINGIWVSAVGQLHLVMFGPGGAGKTMVCNNTFSRIEGAITFETALDETSTPDQVFGPRDIKGMVEDGKTRRITDGMLPEATHGFIDEVMNANAPVKHSLQPIMNERVFHNNGHPTPTPLRMLLAGTNKDDCSTDPNLAPFYDRFHQRYTVGYLKSQHSRFKMVTQAIARMQTIGRGTGTQLPTDQITRVSLADLDQAHQEALALNVEDPVLNLFDGLWQELASQGIVLSDRRYVEGMAAVLAQAWIRGHETVKPGDLDILAHMWWALQDDAAKARSIILAETNPGEKAALDLGDELAKIKAEVDAVVNDPNTDVSKKRRVGIEAVRNTDKLIVDATEHLEKAKAGGTSTTKLDELIAAADAFKLECGQKFWNLDPSKLAKV